VAGGDVLSVAVLAPFVEVVALFFAGGVAGHGCSGDAQQGAGDRDRGVASATSCTASTTSRPCRS
jgi:hypothetical protein